MTRSNDAVRVVVIEDCTDTAESLRLLLELWGYDVRVAATAPAGVALAAAFRPAIALVDLDLPGADGFDVARSLQLLPDGQVPVLVAATGRVGQETRRRAWDAGFDHFVPKPFDPDYLREILAGAATASQEAHDVCGCSPEP